MVAAGDVLGEAFPDLAIASVEPLGEGWDHVAVLVNDELVFRIPWALVEASGPAPGCGAEVALLRAVAGRLPVRVPEPVHVAPNAAFFGYRYLPGPSVQDDLAAGRDLAALAVDVVLAIETLVPVAAGRAMGLPEHADPRHDPSPARATLTRGLVDGTVRAVAERVLGDFTDRWARAAARHLAVAHADLGLDHWLVDRAGGVYALIDWSDACIAPPEQQLSTLMWDLPDLAGEAVAAYRERTGIQLDPQLVFAAGYLNALGDVHELLDEGDDDEGIERCLMFLETWADRGVEGVCA